jgi:hypothetical protein
MRSERRPGRRVKGTACGTVVVLSHGPTGAEGTVVNRGVAKDPGPTGAKGATVKAVVGGDHGSMDAEDAAVSGGVAEGRGPAADAEEARAGCGCQGVSGLCALHSFGLKSRHLTCCQRHLESYLAVWGSTCSDRWPAPTLAL